MKTTGTTAATKPKTAPKTAKTTRTAHEAAPSSPIAPLVGTVAAGSVEKAKSTPAHRIKPPAPSVPGAQENWYTLDDLTETEAAVIEALRTGLRAEQSWDARDTRDAWEEIHLMAHSIPLQNADETERAKFAEMRRSGGWTFGMDCLAGIACQQVIETYKAYSAEIRARREAREAGRPYEEETEQQKALRRSKARARQIFALLTALIVELDGPGIGATRYPDDISEWIGDEIRGTFAEVPGVSISPDACEGMAKAIFGDGDYTPGTGGDAFRIARTYAASSASFGAKFLLEAVAVAVYRAQQSPSSPSSPDSTPLSDSNTADESETAQ